jgi:PEP-CTERM motif
LEFAIELLLLSHFCHKMFGRRFKTMSVPHLRCLLAATVLVLVTVPLHAATLLPPGGSVSPVEGVTVPANIDSFVIDETGSDFFFAPFAGAPFLSGHVDEAVLDDPFGLTCPTCLDFAFQVSVDNTSSYSVYQAILGSFAGLTVNVGYAIESGDIVPNSATRGAPGIGVGFHFGTDANPTLGPNQESVFMLIATDATSYNNSGLFNINGSNFTGEGSCSAGGVHCRGGQVTGLFAPSQVPEPSSALLLGLGLAGIAAIRKRLAAPQRSQN